eukprot:TRINITY_DN74351_c0_g1_i1.p1 TRINITY_DN74351_c0_g1~~TRINITY_DN74351_c0_g1_i1.p1  ORF type:complete len:818 (-),score=121.80 TRINITY_DN74351_c0_g1_i1:242-2695(-)
MIISHLSTPSGLGGRMVCSRAAPRQDRVLPASATKVPRQSHLSHQPHWLLAIARRLVVAGALTLAMGREEALQTPMDLQLLDANGAVPSSSSVGVDSTASDQASFAKVESGEQFSNLRTIETVGASLMRREQLLGQKATAASDPWSASSPIGSLQPSPPPSLPQPSFPAVAISPQVVFVTPQPFSNSVQSPTSPQGRGPVVEGANAGAPPGSLGGIMAGLMGVPVGYGPIFSSDVGDLLADPFRYAIRIRNQLDPSDEEAVEALAEKNRACVQEANVFDCMRRHGSYGLQRLFTYSYKQVEDNSWERLDWMAHPAVRAKRLMEVMLPMSHASSSFEVFGHELRKLGTGETVSVVRQTYDVYQQLRLGIRALDLPVAYNAETRHVYAANGELTVSLVRVLLDVRKFLGESLGEVVLLDLRKATLSENNVHGSIGPLEAEERDPTKVPGQMVHSVVSDTLGDYLADYEKIEHLGLERDPSDAPTIRELVRADARVVYFWEGQQVLCTTVARCSATPGWLRPGLNESLSFGPPRVQGTRSATRGTHRRVIEPLCVNPSFPSTQTDDPVTLLQSIRSFAADTRAFTMRHPPSCYPRNTEVPAINEPPLVHRIDAWLTFSPLHQREMQEALRDDKEIWVSGEALTARTYAERVNFLLLMRALDRGAIHAYKNINLFAMDHVHPTIVHRIISAMQEQPDCGYTMHCIKTGSCFSMDLHSGSGIDRCHDVVRAKRELCDIANDVTFTWRVRLTSFGIMWIAVKLLCLYVFIREPSPGHALNETEKDDLAGTPQCGSDLLGNPEDTNSPPAELRGEQASAQGVTA